MNQGSMGKRCCENQKFFITRYVLQQKKKRIIMAADNVIVTEMYAWKDLFRRFRV